jgi:hypothetical protein
MTDDARVAEIAAGTAEPGYRGAYFRFLQRADVATMALQWATGEMLRGTDPTDLRDALAELVADLVCGTTQKIVPRDMERFGVGAMSKAINLTEGFLGFVKDRKKQDAKQRIGLRLVKD